MKIFKEFKIWWVILLIIGIIISYLFPDSLSKYANRDLNLLGQVFATFVGAFIFLIIPYLISIIIKKEFKGKNFMIAFSISFAFTIILYFFIN
jgi:hypothetical protein